MTESHKFPPMLHRIVRITRWRIEEQWSCGGCGKTLVAWKECESVHDRGEEPERDCREREVIYGR